MSLRRFLYYLLTEDGRSGQVVNGVVTFSGQPKPLPQTPDGWQKLILSWERSIQKHGLVSNITLPLDFVRNGAHIIRDSLYKRTIEDNLYLLIQRLHLELNSTNYNWVYKYFFKGELDLPNAEDGQDAVKVPVIEGGLKKKVKANEDTVYEFPMSDPDCIFIKMDGIRLHEKANYQCAPGIELPYVSFGTNTFVPFTFINKDGSASGIISQLQNAEDVTALSYADKLLSSNWFSKGADNNPSTINVTIRGTVVFTCIHNTANLSLRFRFLRSNLPIGNQDDYEVYDGSQGFVSGETYSFDVNITIPVQPGERLYFESILFGAGSPSDQNWKFEEGSNLSVEFENTYRTTYIKAFRLSNLYRKLIEKVTGSAGNASSDLCTAFDDLLVTCGDAIRGIENATLKTSLSNFFRFVDAVFMAGMNITDKVEIEDRVKYYTPADEVDLGMAKDFTIKPATDLLCNTFKFGHEKQNIEDVNGKYDPNGSNQFTGPMLKVKNEYGAVSPYKAGPYEIEFLRINFDGKTTTDDNSDNDVFAIKTLAQAASQTILLSFVSSGNYIVFPASMNVAPGTKFRVTGSVSNDGIYEVTQVVDLSTTQTVYTNITITNAEFTVSVLVEIISGNVYRLDRPAYTTLEGVPNDTVFNLPLLTPKTMLKRHGRWLRSIHDGLGSKYIEFANGKENKNTELKTVLGGVTIDEDAKENISTLGDLLFRPWYFIFKTEVPANLPELIEENPNRTYKVTDEDGNEWKGFLRVAGIAPNEYTPQEFRLLATADNDMQKLIRA